MWAKTYHERIDSSQIVTLALPALFEFLCCGRLKNNPTVTEEALYIRLKMPSQYRLFSICTLLIVLLTPWFHHDHNSRGLNGLAAAAKKDEDEPYPLYNQIPMHEILQNSLYVTLTQFGEIIVTYTGKGADLKPDDYVTHADGIKVLTGSVQEFLESGLREAVVPVVDDSDVKYGGKRLLGFVMIQSVIPRKIFTRRGEIEFDMEEGM